MADHARFRHAVKIDQHVAAEDQVHSLHEEHFGVVLEIEAIERDELLYFGAYLELSTIRRSEVFSLEVICRVPKGVVSVNPYLACLHGTVVQVRGYDFELPAL